MIMEGLLLKLTADASEQNVRPGESYGVPVQISGLGQKLLVAATVTLEEGCRRRSPDYCGPTRSCSPRARIMARL